MGQRIVYEDSEHDERIVLETPWGEGSGKIPPPIIQFRAGGGFGFTFCYRGPEDDVLARDEREAASDGS